jgi:hypothetical protein
MFKIQAKKIGKVHTVYWNVLPFYLIMSRSENFSEKSAFNTTNILRFSLQRLSEIFSFRYILSDPA